MMYTLLRSQFIFSLLVSFLIISLLIPATALAGGSGEGGDADSNPDLQSETPEAAAAAQAEAAAAAEAAENDKGFFSGLFDGDVSTTEGAVAGAAAGFAFGGPIGAAIGAAVGAAAANADSLGDALGGATAGEAAPGTDPGDGADVGADDRQRRPEPVALQPQLPDLNVRLTGVTLATNGQHEFTGIIKNRGDARATLKPNVEQKLRSKLLLDYGCDGTIDKQELKEQNLVGLPPTKTKNLKVKATPPNGNHCFNFDVDRQNRVVESNENNNRATDWFNFSVSNGEVTEDTGAIGEIVGEVLDDVLDGTGTSSDDTTDTIGTTTVGDTIDNADGATDTDTGSDTTPVEDPVVEDITDILFEVQALRASSSNGLVVNTIGQQLVADGPFQTSAIRITAEQDLAFRWSAPTYDTCTGDFTFIDGATSGDTIDDNYLNRQLEVIEPAVGESRPFRLTCSRGSEEPNTVEITVTTFE